MANAYEALSWLVNIYNYFEPSSPSCSKNPAKELSERFGDIDSLCISYLMKEDNDQGFWQKPQGKLLGIKLEKHYREFLDSLRPIVQEKQRNISSSHPMNIQPNDSKGYIEINQWLCSKCQWVREADIEPARRGWQTICLPEGKYPTYQSLYQSFLNQNLSVECYYITQSKIDSHVKPTANANLASEINIEFLADNAMQLLNVLLQEKIFNIDEADYQELRSVEKENIQRFNEIIDEKLNLNLNRSALVRLKGDMLARIDGRNTLKILEKLDKCNVPTEIMLSTKSIQLLFDKGMHFQDNAGLEKIHSIIMVNKSKLKLLSYTLHERDDKITLHNQKGIELKAIKYLANKLGSTYLDKNARELAITIDLINAKFAENLQAHKLEEIYSNKMLNKYYYTEKVNLTQDHPLEFIILNQSPEHHFFSGSPLISNNKTSQPNKPYQAKNKEKSFAGGGAAASAGDDKNDDNINANINDTDIENTVKGGGGGAAAVESNPVTEVELSIAVHAQKLKMILKGDINKISRYLASKYQEVLRAKKTANAKIEEARSALSNLRKETRRQRDLLYLLSLANDNESIKELSHAIQINMDRRQKLSPLSMCEITHTISSPLYHIFCGENLNGIDIHFHMPLAQCFTDASFMNEMTKLINVQAEEDVKPNLKIITLKNLQPGEYVTVFSKMKTGSDQALEVVKNMEKFALRIVQQQVNKEAWVIPSHIQISYQSIEPDKAMHLSTAGIFGGIKDDGNLDTQASGAKYHEKLML